MINNIQKMMELYGLIYYTESEIDKDDDLFYEDFINIGYRFYDKEEVKELFQVDYRCQI